MAEPVAEERLPLLHHKALVKLAIAEGADTTRMTSKKKGDYVDRIMANRRAKAAAETSNAVLDGHGEPGHYVEADAHPDMATATITLNVKGKGNEVSTMQLKKISLLATSVC
jgi:hypothetical protein